MSFIDSDGSRTTENKAFAKEERTRVFTQKFRNQFEQDFVRVQGEMMNRLRSESPISVGVPPTGPITFSIALDVSSRLYQLADRLNIEN